MSDLIQISIGILIPLAGTALGAAAVFFLKKQWNEQMAKSLFGLAAGVMLASSVWSLLIPALSMEGGVVQSASGFLAGVFLFLGADRLLEKSEATGRESAPSSPRMLALAVTLHNVPEGMAVGVAFAGALEKAGISMAAAMTLAVGIALQNVPEGTVIATPLATLGFPKKKAFFIGVLSGIVEPIGAAAALVFTSLISFLMPLILSFAAGAMVYVIAKELIPTIVGGKGERAGVAFLALGFVMMMLLDVAFG